MPNKVVTFFEGNADQYFKTADAVEKRGRELHKGATAQTPAASPVVAQQKAVTQVVETEAAKRVAIETASAKKSEELYKRSGDKIAEFYKARERILERHAAFELEMQGKVAAAAAKRSAIDGALKAGDTASPRRSNELLEAARKPLIESQAIAAAKAAETQFHLQQGVTALLRQAGLSDQLATGLGEAAAKAIALKAASEGTAVSTSLISSGLAASVVTLGAAAVAGFALVKLSQDIRKASEDRLKAEEKITGEWNKQHQLRADSINRSAQEASGRAFDRFTSSDDAFSLQVARERLQRERAPILSSLNFGTATKDQINELEKLDAQLSKIESRIEGIQQASSQRQKEFVLGIPERTREAEKNFAEFQMKAAQDRADAQKKAAEEQKRAADELKRKADEMKKAFVSAFDSVTSRAAASNPFLKFLTDADKRMEQLKESTKGFSKELQQALVKIEQASNTREWSGLQFDNALQAQDLQRQAKEFRQGFRNDTNDPAVIQKIVADEIRALGLGSSRRYVANAALVNPAALQNGKLPKFNDPRFMQDPFLIQGAFQQASANMDADKLAIAQQKLIGLTQNIDPRNLTDDQRNIVAKALEDEAKRRAGAEKAAQGARMEAVALLKQANGTLNVIAGGAGNLGSQSGFQAGSNTPGSNNPAAKYPAVNYQTPQLGPATLNGVPTIVGTNSAGRQVLNPNVVPGSVAPVLITPNAAPFSPAMLQPLPPVIKPDMVRPPENLIPTPMNWRQLVQSLDSGKVSKSEEASQKALEVANEVMKKLSELLEGKGKISVDVGDTPVMQVEITDKTSGSTAVRTSQANKKTTKQAMGT